MCPAKIAVPFLAPGFAPGLHQPTTCGFTGISSSPSEPVPTLTIGACSSSRGISTRFGDRCADAAAGLLCSDPPSVGISPTLRDFACAFPRPQYGDVVQVSPATATMISTPIVQAN